MSVSNAVRRKTRALRLPERLREEIESLGANGYPNEACGLLLGRFVDGVTDVARVTWARNLNTQRSRDRYALDPRDFLRAERIAEEQGLDVVGVWHSHPDHAAVPSQTDLDAAWPGYAYVIVSVVGGRALETRSWRLDTDRFIEEEVTS